MHKVVLLRHGESVWNYENRFTGWTDVDLSEKGREEAAAAGRALREAGLSFDVAYTSVLKRAIRTLWTVLDVMDLMWLPVERRLAPQPAPLWRPSRIEQGGDGGAVRQRSGEGLATQLRHSAAPPRPRRRRFPGKDRRYAGLHDDELPLYGMSQGYGRPFPALLARHDCPGLRLAGVC